MFRGLRNRTGFMASESTARFVQIEQRVHASPSLRVLKHEFSIVPEASDALRNEITKAFGQLRKAAGFKGRHVVSSVSVASEIYRRFRIARMPEDDIKGAIQWEFARDLNTPVSELYADCLHIAQTERNGKPYCDVLAAAASLPDLHAHLHGIEDAGYHAHAIDGELSALARCFASCNDTANAPKYIVAIRFYRSMAMILVIVEGALRYVRQVGIGHWQMTQRVSEHAPAGAGQLPDAASSQFRAISRELSQDIRLCLHDLRQDGLASAHDTVGVLVGAAEHTQPLLDALNPVCDFDFIPLTSALPTFVQQLIRQIPEDQQPVDDWLAPIGLAMYGVMPGVCEVAA